MGIAQAKLPKLPKNSMVGAMAAGDASKASPNILQFVFA